MKQIIGAIRRMIFKPKFKLGRAERRALEQGRSLMIDDKYGDRYILSVPKNGDAENDLVMNYVKKGQVR